MTRNQASTILNSGGMAEVSLCALRSDHGVQRLCVAKKLLPHLSENQEYQELLINEARLLQHLQHRNVVQIIGVRKFRESLVILLEYVHGVDLRVLLSECQRRSFGLPIPMILHIGSEVAGGLHQAFEAINPLTGNKLEVVHRDVSPSNILISATGEIKITDFGIAENIRLESSLLMGRVSGKQYYMSPEQRNGEKCTVQSDLYSLGCILWELLSGTRLHDFEIQTSAVEISAGALQMVNPSISSEIDEIVTTCLRKNPKDRFASARELRKALEDVAQKQFIPFASEEVSAIVQGLCGDRLQSMANLARQVLNESSSAVIDMSSGSFDSQAVLQPQFLEESTVILGIGKQQEIEFTPQDLNAPVPRVVLPPATSPTDGNAGLQQGRPTLSHNATSQVVFRQPTLETSPPKLNRKQIRLLIRLCLFGLSIWVLTALLSMGGIGGR